MRDHLDELGDAEVVVITFSAPARVLAYQRDHLYPLTVLVDERRTAYAAYELGRGSWTKVWGLNTLREYARLIRQGWNVHRPLDDTLQLGGDFVVDREGRLAYAYRSVDPADRPPVEELVSIVRST